jgi:hypothetical protein
MSIHQKILDTAVRIGRKRRDWSFRPDEIVSALPDVNPSTIRTHVTSRCCVNAPKNHPHRWDYFRRLSRGVYQIEPKYRRPNFVRESSAKYEAQTKTARTIHCEVVRSSDGFSASCVDPSLETTATTLDNVVAKVRDALSTQLGFDESATLALTILEPLSAPPSLDTLVRNINDENRHGETDWGLPRGRESW